MAIWGVFGDCVSHIVIFKKLFADSSTHFGASIMSSFTPERPNTAKQKARDNFLAQKLQSCLRLSTRIKIYYELFVSI